jgi:hypothetical protein
MAGSSMPGLWGASIRLRGANRRTSMNISIFLKGIWLGKLLQCFSNNKNSNLRPWEFEPRRLGWIISNSWHTVGIWFGKYIFFIILLLFSTTLMYMTMFNPDWNSVDCGLTGFASAAYQLICLKHIYNFWCSMLVYTLFVLCFVTLRGVFMYLTY